MSESWASRSFKRSVNPRPSHGGFPKWGYPKKDGLQWKILFKLMIWEYPHFRKPPHWLMEMQKHCQTAGTWKRASFQKVSSGANTWRIMHSIVRAKLLDSLARIAVLEDERWWIQRTKGKHQQDLPHFWCFLRCSFGVCGATETCLITNFKTSVVLRCPTLAGLPWIPFLETAHKLHKHRSNE